MDDLKYFHKGCTVVVLNTAIEFADKSALSVPDCLKGQEYTVGFVARDRVLLEEVQSWLYKKDVLVL
jgi:hypothetical protein